MQIIWLGHSSFRIEIEDQVLLIDPWLTSNPMMEEQNHETAIKDTSQILVTHGHFDHTADIVQISQTTKAPVSGVYEIGGLLKDMGAVEGHAFHLGGTIHFGEVRVTMVPASHSSSMNVEGKIVYTGAPVGYMIRGEGKTIYLSGDTGISAEMQWMGEYFKPEIGILCAGGYYTMDMAQAAWAARRYFDFETIIPCHYRTFPLLEQSAEALAAGVDATVIEPQVMQPIGL